MTRSLLGIGLALYVALTTGEVPFFAVTTCIEDCPDDNDEGQCSPTCNDCACCTHVRSTTPPPTVKAELTEVTSRTPERTQVTPPSPEPHEILHVPIA